VKAFNEVAVILDHKWTILNMFGVFAVRLFDTVNIGFEFIGNNNIWYLPARCAAMSIRILASFVLRVVVRCDASKKRVSASMMSQNTTIFLFSLSSMGFSLLFALVYTYVRFIGYPGIAYFRV